MNHTRTPLNPQQDQSVKVSIIYKGEEVGVGRLPLYVIHCGNEKDAGLRYGARSVMVVLGVRDCQVCILKNRQWIENLKNAGLLMKIMD